jgi:uncharacterized protein YkwD
LGFRERKWCEYLIALCFARKECPVKRSDILDLRNEVLIALTIVGFVLIVVGTNLILNHATARSVSFSVGLTGTSVGQQASPMPGSYQPSSVPSPGPTCTSQLTRIPADQLPTQLDVLALQSYMLNLVNADRRAAGLTPVQWDNFAAQVGQAHAEDMAANDYLSHWNLAGEGPDVRYGRAGGTETVQENVYMYQYRYGSGSPAPIEDWETVIRDAEISLMRSPGHRANILAPEHTHVGVGIAYNPATGAVHIAQEFLNRYVSMEPLPVEAHVGDTLTVKGQLLPSASNPLINLAYEPFPQPMTVSQVEARLTYKSPAEFLLATEPGVDVNGHFVAQVALGAEGLPGIYHVLIWVDVGEVSVHTVNAVIDARQ